MSNIELLNQYRQQLFNYYCKECEQGFIRNADYNIHISEKHDFNVACIECGIIVNASNIYAWNTHKCWFKKCECGHDRDYHSIWNNPSRCVISNCLCKRFE